MENGHILLWLIKDTCWALEFKTGGIVMVVPTVTVAFFILWKSKHIRSEFFHNLAVCFWILANSLWMLGEFFNHDARPYAVVLFATGLALLAFYYLAYFRKDQQATNESYRQFADPKSSASDPLPAPVSDSQPSVPL